MFPKAFWGVSFWPKAFWPGPDAPLAVYRTNDDYFWTVPSRVLRWTAQDFGNRWTLK